MHGDLFGSAPASRYRLTGMLAACVAVASLAMFAWYDGGIGANRNATLTLAVGPIVR